MDELDRMFRRLVHNVRAGFPDLMSRPFEVSAIHQHIIPYRLNRAELGIDTAEEYEVTLMRLLSGARGLLTGDPDMQAALQAELESPNPDLSIFRAWGTASVSIPAAAVRALDSQSPPAVRISQPMASRQAEMAGRATVEVTASSASPTALASPPSSTAVPQPPPVAPKPATAAPKPGAAATRPGNAPTVTKPSSAPAHPAHGGCRYCGGELPEGRDAHFCPHCGQNLTVKQCPACSTELEVEWQFCITCGRQVE
jgi:hypothetical protein